MKDSGVEWIGEIPTNWKLIRLQWVLDEVIEKNNPVQTKNILSLTNKLGVVPYSEKGNKGNVAKENYDEYKLAYPDTIVTNSMNILIGSVGYCQYYGCVSPVYYVFKSKGNNNIHFLNYLFQTQQFQKELRKYANGILEIRLRVSSSDILKREVAMPDVQEQNKIVDLLDKKLQVVDSLISNQEKQIEKLEEYKQAIITKAVTKGLDSDAKLKDSGVEWIGEIPEKWNIRPLKFIFDFSKGLPITKENLTETGIKVISYGQIHAKYNKSVTIDDRLYRYVPSFYLQNNPECLVNKYDFIVADTSEDRKGTGDFIHIDCDDQIFAGYHSIILRNKNNVFSFYYAYLFMSDPWRNQFRCKVGGVKLFSLTQKILSGGFILVPPIDEQKSIVEHIQQKCSSMDKSIELMTQKIEKLESVKKSLIYEYVTGKKRVV